MAALEAYANPKAEAVKRLRAAEQQGRELEAANARLQASLRNTQKYLRTSQRRVNDLENERAAQAARIAELEELQRRHEGAVQAAYFAAWNECTQYVAQAAHAARAVNSETILTLMGEHQ
jgi:CRISPR/Cas system-associated endonuclease Cas1